MRHKYARQIRGDCLSCMKQVIAAKFLSDLVSVALPTLTAGLVGSMADDLLAMNAQNVMNKLPAFLLAMALNVLAIPLLSMWEYMQMGKRGFDYDHKVMSRFLRKPLREIQQRDAGVVLERLEGDLGDFCWNTVFVFALPAVLVCYAVVVGVVVVQSQYAAPFMAVLLLMPMLPVAKAQYAGGKKAAFRQEAAAYAEERRGLEDNVTASKEFLRTYRLETAFGGWLRALYDRYMRQSGEKKRVFEGTNAALDLLLKHGVPVCVLAVGGALVCAERMSAGALVGGYLMLPALEQCYAYGVKLVEEMRTAPSYIERIAIFYGEQEAKERDLARPVEQLCAEKLRFSYQKGKAPVLNDCTVCLRSDEATLVEGKNGSGKSTLLSLLSGLYAPDMGAICDQTGARLTVGQLRRAVALQEQDGAIFSGTLVENLFIERERQGEAQRLLDALALDKPLSYPVEAGGRNLSPGERKKLLLIRALLKPAAFTFLDEPFNHLDAQGKAALEALFLRKKGLVLVSHQTIREPGKPWTRISLDEMQKIE